MRGKFIVVEGLDGSGKGTQTALLCAYLKSQGQKCVSDRRAHRVGDRRYDKRCAQRRKAAHILGARRALPRDRVAHNMNPVNGIEKTLEAGIDVVCDRYYYSSIAYQAVGEDRQWVIDMNLNCPGILKPDICIFFDVDPESCHERIENGRVYLEIFERDPEQINAIRERYYSAFELLKDRDNIVVIDAARDIDSVAADVRKAIDTVIK